MCYVWCDNSRCYGNSFTSAEPPHLLGGWAESLYLRPDTFVYKVHDGLSAQLAMLAELMACAASLDKIKEFSSYAMGGFNACAAGA
jgi:threonine dehydrogenase-like Zn-dependent dehydrogenase